MATFFQSFRSSAMPKRLLRYALSRLELLDADALDMEHLDLALGRNSVFEFRDVGIKLQKLEKLLSLPPTFALQRAKVLLLRVTVPMDFYTSPITVEVDGVDVRLKVLSGDARPRRRRKGQGDDGTIPTETIPTAADLAQSFLQAQASAETKELEAALAAETQDLGASVAMSDEDGDEDLAYGTGQALSLPAFLTDFLQGVVDRTQISIRGVAFRLDVELPALDAGTDAPELVTFELSLEGINVEGVTTAPGSAEGDDGGPAKIVSKEGKRHIALDNIRAALISEANVFSSLARSPSMPSSLASQSPVETDRPPPFPRQSSDLSAERMADSQEILQDSEEALGIPYDLGESDDERPEHDPQDPVSPASTPRASMYQEYDLQYQASSETIEPKSLAWNPSPTREARSEPLLRAPDGGPPPIPTLSRSGSATSHEGSLHDDLAQSHLFSHEEAESMYMSAFSQAESTRLRSMPGAWDEEEGGEAQGEAAAIPEDTGTKDATAPREEPPEGESSDTHSESAPDSDAGRQDDAPTPRGPTRLVKEILSLASVSVYVPSNHKHLPVAPTPNAMGASASPNLPGAFSVHSMPAPTSPEIPPQAPDEPADKALEINLAPLEVRFDASLGFLLAMVVSKLLEAVRGQQAKEQEQKETSEPAFSEIRVVAQHISLLFLEKLVAVADTPERVLAPPTASRDDILLRASLENVACTTAVSGPQTSETTVGVDKFTFGYANEAIIDFDREIRLFESVVSTTLSSGRDISIRVSQTPDDTRCNIDTLPLRVRLDLQRLDETLSWFGGLGSFLSMSSSIASDTGSPPRPAQPKPRGVRFDAPVRPDDQSAAKENKVALRINGFRLDLMGRECRVGLDTSALKLVSREEAVGVHFSRIRLAGPYARDKREKDAPVVVDVVGTRLEYLALPHNADLERLLELITPSKARFDADQDEIMVDTLLRQRRKGPVLRLTLDKVSVRAEQTDELAYLPGLGQELARLGSVAKYLPQDDRPGLLTLGLVKDLDLSLDAGGRIGVVRGDVQSVDVAHITLPALVAVSAATVSVERNEVEELVSTSSTNLLGAAPGTPQRPPVLMMRMMDDMEPTLKVRLVGLVVEYRVPAVMDVLGLGDDATPQDFEASLAASVAHLGGQAHAVMGRGRKGKEVETVPVKAMAVDLTFRDCLIGLNPLGLPSKLVVALTDAHVDVVAPDSRDNIQILGNVKKASLLLTDDVAALDSTENRPAASRRRPSDASSRQVVELCSKGFVDVCQISAAKATVRLSSDPQGERHVDVELRDDLLVVETCADSTQTLMALANALKPPTPPSREIKYKTSVVPVQDLLASLTADAFGRAEGDYDFDNDFAAAYEELGGDVEEGSPLELDSQYWEGGGGGGEEVEEELFDAAAAQSMLSMTTTRDTHDGVLLSSTHADVESGSDDLVIQDDFFFEAEPAAVAGTAHRWDSARNTYDRTNDGKVLRSPLRVRVRDVHVIWNLFDGYDWDRTRSVISKAVHDVEAKAYEKKARSASPYEPDGDEAEETVIGDFLFNSIYIGIPANRDPRELAQAINQDLNDNATETESVATTSYTATTAGRAASGSRKPGKKLKLGRSRHHKITFELRGVDVDVITFPPGSGETQSSVDVRVRDLDIFDHVPTSTWKKFAMYDADAGEREMGTSMVHVELLSVQPVADAAASEIVLKAAVAPLRLHVDQDALDFITRFFEFKDGSAAPVSVSPSDVPFIQRAEVAAVPVRLDFKPKRVDYAGLRSGHTTEFMNFLILEDARMVLRHTIIYGVSGFDRLGDTLNDVWMPDIKRTQLPGILAGLAPVRSLVNVGSGIRDLVEIPIREYRKDGRIVRSIGKGAAAFARTTGTEMVKLGAKLAVGTQYALQGAETLLVKDGSAVSIPKDDDDDDDGDDDGNYYATAPEKQISLYADQPAGVVQGLRGAYSSLSRDLYLARDAVIAVPGEVMESQNAQGAARAVLRRAPTIIFRPAIGATKAIGKTLLGATNSLDPNNRRRVDAKYKKY